MEKWIMHVDMDAFYASIEQRDHAAYRGKPLIVGGLGNRGVVATASYEARIYGVHSAMSMSEARRRCPEGIFIRGNHALYGEVSRQIFAIFTEFSPVVEPLALDEAFMDITGMEGIAPDRRVYALALKQRIKSEVGLIASVGIAPNKFLAKFASDLEKPDGLVIIAPGEGKAMLQNLPIRTLWGIGKKTAMILEAMGFHTVGQIAAADAYALAKHIGILAYQIVDLANGRDNREVESYREVQSIGNEMTFEDDLLTRDQVERQFLALAEKVAWRLRQSGYKARTIVIKIRMASFVTITRSQTLAEASNYDEEIYRSAISLYRKANVIEKIRLIGITASHLIEREQISLFEDNQKKKALYQAVDALKGRFGEKVITKANLIEAEKPEEV